MRVSYTAQKKLEVIAFYKKHGLTAATLECTISKSMVYRWCQSEATLATVHRNRRSFRTGKVKHPAVEADSDGVDPLWSSRQATPMSRRLHGDSRSDNVVTCDSRRHKRQRAQRAIALVVSPFCLFPYGDTDSYLSSPAPSP